MPMPQRSLASSSINSSIIRVAFGALLSIAIWGCSGQAEYAQPAIPPPPPPQPVVAAPHPTAPTKVTTASWYGPGLHGHPTSSGEVYNQQALTAASPTLPLGSHARVTNLKTGKSVVVRINDRGPFKRGRGIDLSHAAAKRIGIDHRGIAKVAVTRVGRPVRKTRHSSTEFTKKPATTPAKPIADADSTTPPVVESSIAPSSTGLTSKESPPPSR